MSKNCPFCPKESEQEAWGFGPEGWQNARERHKREHCRQCSECGQDILKVNSKDKENGKT